ncbi:hypothetical protein AWL63_08655 [Sphingomonas panacis]|uniref:Uncharacterized protein n=1 Tax=Sphingomonas panacis TaxID=1560345 RepID=A0A1B3Z9B9_9SPHN|nr:hypothetical protein [Sphingomonas panacis]AOH84028.1 hypothetical protein AWL63_08655 [Sphingomonas panacis]
MIFANRSNSAEYSSLPARITRRTQRSVWTSAPVAKSSETSDLGHETEVMRALSLAVPLSLVLWAPLIWVVAYSF